ncbi:MAG: hypothetical protein FOGNACKC_06431 [Anaerolineae bacterium]|nr:hypothetical protein [Anaerolineae bacterium]
MKPAVLLALLICGIVLAGLATRNGALLALALPLLVYLAAALLAEPAPPQLAVTRQLSADRAAAGEAVTVTLNATNTGPRLAELHLTDHPPAGLKIVEGDADALAALEPGQSLTLSYRVAGQRGLYRFEPVLATAREPLGLFAATATFAAPGQFFVLPPVARVRRVAIRPPRTGVYAGLIPARQGGPGIEFFGVRDYQPGDPLRWINERASARHEQRLFVTEFEQERVVDVGLILDARAKADVVAGGESLFEYGVQAAAALADSFLNSGNRVGLFIYGRSLDWTFAGYGKVQRERILRALARATQGGGSVFEKLEHLPTQLFPVRSQLVLVSPLLSHDAEILIKLRARGYRLLVISPDPISFEQPVLAPGRVSELALRLARLERNILLKQLREAEIQVIDWPISVPFYQIAHQALSRPFYQRGGGGG